MEDADGMDQPERRDEPDSAEEAHGREDVVEVAVRPGLTIGMLAGLIPVVALVFLGTALYSGVRDALLSLATIAAALLFAAVCYLSAGWWRARADARGVTLAPWRDLLPRRRAGRLRFEWAEVKAVRAPRGFFERNARHSVVELDRPARTFWRLRAQPENRVALPPALWQDGRLAEAFRAHVPADRIEPGALSPARALPHPRLLAGGYALAALLAGWIAWQTSEGHFTGLVGWATVALVAAAMLMQVLSSGIERSELQCAHGLTHAALGMVPMVLLLTLFAPCRAAAPALAAGTALMFIVLSALLPAGGGRAAWAGAAAVAGAFALGAAAGAFSYSGVAGRAICVGDLQGSAWTPDGGAFIVRTGAEGVLDLPRPAARTSYQWFGRDGGPGPSASVPGGSWIHAVGSTGALVRGRAGGDEDAERALWFLPRGGEPRVLACGECVGVPAVSPGGTRALVTSGDDARMQWRLFDFATQELRPCGEMETLSPQWCVGVSDEGRLYWVEGAPPLNASGKPVSRSTPLPPDGRFPNAGSAHTIFSTGPMLDGPKETLYRATTPWIEWRRGPDPLTVHVCRLAEGTPPRLEFVRLEIGARGVTESPLSEETYRERVFTPYGVSAHYDILYAQGAPLSPPRLVERATGRSCPLEGGGATFLGFLPNWSPDGRRFLTTSIRLKIGWDSLRWTKTPDFTDNLELVVRLVEPEEVFGRAETRGKAAPR